MENLGIDLNELKKLLIEAINVFAKDFKPKLKAVVGSEMYLRDLMVMALLTKSMKSARAIKLLCDSGYGEDSMCVVRSIFENYIHLAYAMKEDSLHRADLFLKYGELDFYRQVRLLPNKPIDVDAKIPALRALFEDQFLKYERENVLGRTKYSWSSLTLKRMAQIVGSQEEYEKLYVFMSQYSHPHSKGLSDYFENMRFDDSPSTNLVEESLVFAISQVIQLLVLVNRVSLLQADAILEGLNSRYGDILS